MARFAAIDVGSNALRLRIIEVVRGETPVDQLDLLPGDRDAEWHEVISLRAPVRLGVEVFSTGRLAPTSIGAACAALKDFRTQMDAARVDAYRAAATSAVREASNGATLVERARREAGVELEVIEGVEEARLIQLAVRRRLDVADKRALLVDIGGGSTELTVLDHGKSVFAASLQMGTVRLLETFLRGTKTVDEDHARLLHEAIERALGEARRQLGPIDVVAGTGGNLETLADLCPAKVAKNERAIDVEAMRKLFGKLCEKTAADRAKTWSLRPDRADTIVPATAIVMHVADAVNVPRVVVPGAGLKDGILEELSAKYFHTWDADGEAESVVQACLRLGRRYQFDEAHGVHVMALAGRLFDEMVDLHGLSPRDRLLLRAAALLHDIGDFVRYDGHHKHSYYLIQHADIMGLSPDERAIVANVARYHRKSPPDPTHPNFRELDKDSRGRVRALAAMLRIADALDREHLQKVQDVHAGLDRETHRLKLRLQGAHDRDLEEWTVLEKSGLLRDVFGVEVVLVSS